MSPAMEDEIKRWTAKRKSGLEMEVLQGKTTVAEASRAYDLPPSESETWIDEAKRGMENALRANPLDIVPGSISLFKGGARAAKDLVPPYKEALLAVDAAWGEPRLWRGMESASSKYTTEFYKVASDHKLTDDGWAQGGDKERIYLYLFFKTFLVSGIITVICLLLAFPSRASSGRAADVEILALDDHGAAAVLDLASGADDKLDRAVAGAGDTEQPLGLDGDY